MPFSRGSTAKPVIKCENWFFYYKPLLAEMMMIIEQLSHLITQYWMETPRKYEAIRKPFC